MKWQRTPQWWQRLETRMIIQAAMAALLPMLALGAMAIFALYSQQVRTSHALQVELSHRAQLLVESRLENVVTVLQATVAAPDWLEDTASARTNLQLHYLLHKLPLVREINLLDENGRTYLRVSRDRVFTGADTADIGNTPFFGATRRQNVVWGHAYISANGEPFIQVLVPAYNPVTAQSDRYLWAVISLRQLWDQLSTFRAGEGGVAYILDDEGRLLAHPDFSLVLGGTSLRETSLFRILQSGKPIPTSYLGVGNIQVFGSVTPVPALHGWIVVEQPVETALKPVRTLFNMFLGGLLLAMIASGVPGWFIARRVTKPIVQLSKDAVAVGNGDLTRRSVILRNDEIGQLAESFNKMVAELQEYASALEAKVAERTQALQVALAQAEEADRLKTAFLATVSHELRTPLVSIKGFAETLLSDDVVWDRADEQDFLQTIVDETDRMRDLVNQLLDMARLESGTLRLHRRPASVANIIKLTVEQLRPLTVDHPIVTNFSADEPLIFADPERMVNVFRNLLENAIKYTPPQTPIHITVQVQADTVQVSIADTGLGIPPDELPHLFERFRRGTHPDIPGTGLGLAICKGLVEAHEGKIWVESQLGQGATFHILLPLLNTGEMK